MECSRIRHILFSESEEDLTEELRGQLRHHLSGCPSCSAQFHALEEQSKLLRSLPRHEAPAGFLQSVTRRVEAPRQSFFENVRDRLSTLMGSRPLLRFAATAAVAIVVLTSARHVLRENSVEHGVLVTPPPPTASSPGAASAPSDTLRDNHRSEDRTSPNQPGSYQVPKITERGVPAPFTDGVTKSVPDSVGDIHQPEVTAGAVERAESSRPPEVDLENRPFSPTPLPEKISPQRQLSRKKEAAPASAGTTPRMLSREPVESRSKMAPTESKTLNRMAPSAPTGMGPLSDAAPGKQAFADIATPNRAPEGLNSQRPQPPASPGPLATAQPAPSTVAERIHEVSIALTLNLPGNSSRGEMKISTRLQRKMKEPGGLSNFKAGPLNHDSPAPGPDSRELPPGELSKPSTGAELPPHSLSGIKSSVLQANGKILSEKSDPGSIASSVLVLEIPAQNYSELVARLQAFGKTEVKSDHSAGLPRDTMVRVTLTLSAPHPEK